MLAAGYAPAVGFLHSGKPLSFVYDIADLFKFETVVPEAFRVAGQHARAGSTVRRNGRASCLPRRLSPIEDLARLIPAIEDVLTAGGLPRPEATRGCVGPAFDDPPPPVETRVQRG